MLFITDGGKGIYKGIREVLGDSAVIARYQRHKRENMLSYLGEDRRPGWMRRLQSASEQPIYELAKKALSALRSDRK